ncbi:rRNA pseudouridine synthase [Pelagibacteraceae bacterium]|nr:rRNA pseudouridine synthase [Pelagibacteraceae bacterium]
MKNIQVSERIAKVIARGSKFSRRDAEKLIADGRVKIDNKIILQPNINVTSSNNIKLDNKSINFKPELELYKYYKPRGVLVTHHDPENRKTIFDDLPKKFEKMISIGRLDYDSEGLLLLTNNGDIKRTMELPNNNWKRTYRVRVHGRVEGDIVLKFKKGLKIDRMRYKPILANIDNTSNSYTWLTMTLTEGKNREIRNIFEAFGMIVTRLIRVSYGPYKLNKLNKSEFEKLKYIEK